MASKGQKFKKYSSNLKSMIIEELKQGYSYRFLSKKYGISEKTISTWQQKIRHPEKYQNQGLKRGPKNDKNLTKEEVLLYEKLKQVSSKNVRENVYE